ncbi:MAG TPA: hypothetical protein VG477_01775, partial [Thermoanaerobaculia bacterium]|nr:hypothetical protein [Thermoanaerobaculia bacterium]
METKRRFSWNLLATAFLCLWIGPAAFAQQPAPAEAPLVVRVGDAERAFTLDDLKKLPQHTVK